MQAPLGKSDRAPGAATPKLMLQVVHSLPQNCVFGTCRSLPTLINEAGKPWLQLSGGITLRFKWWVDASRLPREQLHLPVALPWTSYILPSNTSQSILFNSRTLKAAAPSKQRQPHQKSNGCFRARKEIKTSIRSGRYDDPSLLPFSLGSID